MRKWVLMERLPEKRKRKSRKGSVKERKVVVVLQYNECLQSDRKGLCLGFENDDTS